MASSEQSTSFAHGSAQMRDDHEKPPPSTLNSQQVEIHYITSPDESEVLPVYSDDLMKVSEDLAGLAALLRDDGEGLPVTAYPLQNNYTTTACRRRCQIVNLYYDAIAAANLQLLSTLLTRGLVTPRTTNNMGQTPLIAAVGKGKATVVRFLLDSGADINAYGVIELTEPTTRRRKHTTIHDATYCTPLQYAAQLGNFTIVKLLMENGADDALIAPDGQLALRLAVVNGHREIVDNLPRRRGGGFKRWEAKHFKAMQRCKKAAQGIYAFGRFFIWVVPRFFVWSLPKHVIVLPCVKRVKWLHAHRAEIPGIIADKMKKVWVWLKKAPAALWRGIKKAPGVVGKFMKGIAYFVVYCAKDGWTLINSLPKATKIALTWLWTGFKNTGNAIGNVFAQIFSFIHTVCAAIASFFQRVTLKDVQRGFIMCLHVIFVGAPQKLWKWLCSFREMSLEIFEALFGIIGWFMWELIKCAIQAVLYIPVKLGEILVACGGSMRAGGKEILVWFDPKKA